MKEEDSSSLELLLDTMCNTFGGVMFIAITLAVVLFSRNALKNQQTPEERTVQRHEELMRQIEEEMIGAAKELIYDLWMKKGTPEWIDFIGTTIGGIVGTILSFVIIVLTMLG